MHFLHSLLNEISIAASTFHVRGKVRRHCGLLLLGVLYEVILDLNVVCLFGTNYIVVQQKVVCEV